MTNQQILIKAIQNAIDGGWKPSNRYFGSMPDEILAAVVAEHYEFEPEHVIFNHDFAKALWGLAIDDATRKNNWRYHLQNMIIAEDPIKYLKENI